MSLLAQGLFPVDPDSLFSILLIFLNGEDEVLRNQANSTLNGLPPRLLQQHVENPDLQAEDLNVLAQYLRSTPMMEKVLRHKNVSIQTVAFLASRVPSALQEIIITNVGKIIDHPEILEALESNPSLDPFAKRRILEIRQDFFKQDHPEEPVPQEIFPGPGEEIPQEMFGEEYEESEEFTEDTFGEDLFEIPKEIFETFGMTSLPDDMLFSDLNMTGEELADEEEATLYQTVLKMTVPQKVEVALKGSKEARGILIRDANKLVKAAVVMSPKVTESEINVISGMRDVPAEVMRLISQRREWMRKYPIVRQVIYNPHTPVGVSLGLLPRMNDKDLKDLTSEKDVPDPVRQAAKRLYNVRKTNR
ncbi:MAG TPA: hypothetical protein PK014_09060 [Thermoanaerobaculia bacterium]|nr:hypothetical protein [Thermoanaerobaculia bacterium]HUM30334.1 hypothetical protein [Thermoanaerobaculia bacterium]HXK68515.1 hypothetical protein [Thermoanaerobaculia bacterium]